MSNKNDYRRKNLSRYRGYSAKYRHGHPETIEQKMSRAELRNKLYSENTSFRLFRKREALARYYLRKARIYEERIKKAPESALSSLIEKHKLAMQKYRNNLRQAKYHYNKFKQNDTTKQDH